MPVGEAARGCELRSVCQLRNAGAKRRGGEHPQQSGASARRRDAKRPPAQRTRWQSNASTQRSAPHGARGRGVAPPPEEYQGQRFAVTPAGRFAKGTPMSVEKKIKAASGWGMLGVILIAFIAIVAVFVLSIIGLVNADEAGVAASPLSGWGLGLSITAFCLIWIPVSGFFTLQPGQARVCILFGDYKGTVRDEGFRWANPFYSRSMGSNSATEDAVASAVGKSGLSLSKSIETAAKAASGLSTKVSVRARTLNGDILKVNDKMGNPIEIANVVVWHVADTAKALFDVDNYEQFVATQAETALRHVASIYAYDHAEDSSDSMDSITLRSNIEEVSTALKHELTQRLAPAGVAIDDARLTHLAYAPEIAQAMLRRQQAEAVIAARKKIVEGAVTMVEMAVDELGQHGKIELDEERKAQMASNLMVVLCGESEAHPIVNAGSLY